jgi:hypothetical protein
MEFPLHLMERVRVRVRQGEDEIAILLNSLPPGEGEL